jgi:electron transfer flavoprotein alpha subunit
MNGTLVIGWCESGSVDVVTAELVTAAVALGGPVTLGIMAPDPAAIGNTNTHGVDRLIGIRLPGQRSNHEVLQRAVEALIDTINPRTVLMPFNWDSAAFAASLAEQRDFSFASDVIELSCEADGTIIAVRPVYAGKVKASLRLPSGNPSLLLLRPGIWAPAANTDQGMEMEISDVVLNDISRVRLIKVIKAIDGDADLTQAEVIFALGRGVGKREHITVFEEIAKKFGVPLGASRPLVDVGLIPRGRQIGQSGVTVKPKLYVAFGISGSLQHMAGMSTSKTIFAINTDKEAPIFDAAHLGAHVDAMEVARLLLDDD